MSKPSTNAMEKHERANLEAARIILADSSAIGLQREWAERFMARWEREHEPPAAPAQRTLFASSEASQ